MTKGKKIELLYNIAKGNQVNISAVERKELRKYKVEHGEYEFYTTKKNIARYVEAVDSGNMLAFRDWCRNNGYADRRRTGSDKSSMKKDLRQELLGCALFGSIFWIICLGTLKGGLEGVLVPGALISVFMCFISRKYVRITNVVLPLAIAILYCVFR